ncbi:MAG: prenyltransferase/squalene oxidase repeat-containing protein [Propionibacteriaceae bacterium]|nr:prenyltransferase/squalene oxidase repeat-containing protein [Propionibacteriaceae bacterium]
MALPVVAALFLGLGGSPAAAAPDRDKARAAGAWVAAQTSTDGIFSSVQDPDTGRDVPDFGLTLDVALGATAAGVPASTVNGWLTAAAPAFSRHRGDNGIIAKTLVALAATGNSTTSYGGLNPRDLTARAVGANGHAAGTNAFGQAFTMIGLARTTALPPSTVTFLTQQQCASGAFPMYFGSDAAGHCDAARKTPDPDGTAMLVMALRAAEASGNRAAAAPRAKAVAWLKSQQRADGSFAGSPNSTPTPNTNTAGLVAAALSDLEADTVARIGTWVAGLQLATGRDAGAIAYDRDTLASARDGAVSALGRGRWVRSTVQGALALAPIDFYRLVPKYQRTAPYTLPGDHTISGRQWRTSCEPYSATERCRTEIWATVVRIENGQFVRQNGWAFNNLTYLPYMTESAWQGNPLAMHNMTGFSSGGRQWRTECHTTQTGRGACRSYTMTTVYAAAARAAGGYTFSQSNTWVFNNIVMFGHPAWR